MSLINESHSSNSQTSLQYWQDELKNARVLLFEIDKAINAITQTNLLSYEIDTGQSKQRVTRMDIPQLITQRTTLLGTIRQLEMYLGEGRPNVVVASPDW
jgi:hypothetical protein